MTAPNPSTALAMVVLDELRRNGVGHVVIAPGSRSAALALAAAAIDVQVHIEIDERSAGFLAVGLGRSGVPAVVVTTSGSAVANLLPAVVEADLSAVPMIVASADRPEALRRRGANQSIEQHGIFGERVRWEWDPGVASSDRDDEGRWRDGVAYAVRAATGSPVPGDSGTPRRLPGPVHLDLPFEEPLVPLSDDGRDAAAPYPHDLRLGSPPVRVPGPERVRLESSGRHERTLVVVGDTGLGVDVELAGTAHVVEAHARRGRNGALRGMHYLASHPERDRLRPDRTIRIGRTGLSRPLDAWTAEGPVVMVDPTGRWSAEEGGRLEMTEHAEIPLADPAWLADLEAVDAAVTGAVGEWLDGADELTEPGTARDVSRVAAQLGHRLAVASSMPIRDVDLFMDANADVVANRGASGIDGFVSTVLGLALDQPTIGLGGDLSVLHDSNGFLLDDRPDCTFVVLDNDGGGIFSFLPQAGFPTHFERLFGTPHGRSFADLARLHRLGHRLVTSPGELAGAVRSATSEPGVSVVEVRTERARNVEVHAALRSVAHAAITRALSPSRRA